MQNILAIEKHSYRIINYTIGILLIVLFLFIPEKSKAQSNRSISYYITIEQGDTIINGLIPMITIFPTLKFNSEDEWREYAKLVRDVKKTLPYANQISRSLIETYEMMETLPDKKAKEKHLKSAEKYMMEEYKPKMKKLTKRQGLILIKLIDRQTNSSAYDIIKAITGSFKATSFNIFAGAMGNSLKTRYDPVRRDKMIERIVIELQQGTL